MNKLIDRIRERAASILPEIISLRRHFHANPELSYKEFQTALFISRYLTKLGIRHKAGIAGTGIIGYIEGTMPGKINVALRAEMDALPITEENEIPYRSTNNGIMHACAHDAHMAMLLGTAVLLNEMREYFGGRVILIFQPGEEKSPGGASLIIESGELNDPEPSMVIAHHVLPELETGCVGYRSGTYMASADEIHITIKGKGGHAALTGLITDQIYIASELIIRLKDTIAYEQKTRDIPTVFGIGRIDGPGATNIIPVNVTIAGTFRTFDEKWRVEAHSIMRAIAVSIASKYGVDINLNVAKGYPVLRNDETLAGKAEELSRELLGSGKVKQMEQRMSSDDFSFFTGKYPSLYYRIGIRPPGQPMKMLHTPLFDIDEKAMQTGMENMTWLTMNLLNNQ